MLIVEDKKEKSFFINSAADIFTLLKISTDIFKSEGINSARIDSELLLCRVLRVDRSYLYTYPEQKLEKSQINEFSELVALRKKRMPLQYLIGKQEFWSRDFIIKEGVFIPRPETERLIEIIIDDFEKLKIRTKVKNEDIRILDIGTGSGVIAITLKCEMPFIKVCATDISYEALKTAQLNAEIHIENGAVDFLLARSFETFRADSPSKDKPFHIVVSNPPYIPEGDCHKLQPEIAKYEPKEALFSGEEGIDMIKELIEEAPKFICPGGMLILEIGEGQKNMIKEIYAAVDKYDEINFYDDYSSYERVAQLWIK
ncbi:MAG: peptide chain release factor N(5)-glutamine methyltransferase [Candidatus Schekmanbacteria bacterium]|nr:MAG: peptide chain release factor N(5)-glutamine methyltransferase [Candidatus Schekmanbacteria bacterium]